MHNALITLVTIWLFMSCSTNEKVRGNTKLFRETFLSRVPELTSCFQNYLNSLPKDSIPPRAIINVNVIIKNGRVTKIGYENLEGELPEKVSQCMSDIIINTNFPKFKEALEVRQPINFYSRKREKKG